MSGADERRMIVARSPVTGDRLMYADLAGGLETVTTLSPAATANATADELAKLNPGRRFEVVELAADPDNDKVVYSSLVEVVAS